MITETDALTIDLRDYFAAQIMAGFVSSPSWCGSAELVPGAQEEVLAEWAYIHADAMIEARD